MIDNLELKLSGELPVNREELINLVSYWGRSDDFYLGNDYYINICESKEKYDLSNLDVSQIEDLSYIFKYSEFDGDISKWNVSNCKDMERMFFGTKFNSNLSNWNISNVKNMNKTFACSILDFDISLLNFNKNIICDEIFIGNSPFEKKYNNGNRLPNNTEKILEWFENNKDKIREINIPKEKILDFFSFDEKIKEIV